MAFHWQRCAKVATSVFEKKSFIEREDANLTCLFLTQVTQIIIGHFVGMSVAISLDITDDLIRLHASSGHIGALFVDS